MLLTGEYHHQIDEKGRIRIPSKLKEALGTSPMVMRGSDGCLFVYSKEKAEKVFEKHFDDADFADSASKRALRLIAASAVFLEEDKQGRILLPANLIKHCGIKKNIVTIGAYDRVEIWSEENWNSYADIDEVDFDACLKDLGKKE